VVNSHWFEILTRRLAGEQPRRRFMDGLMGIVVAGALLPRSAEAGCKKIGKNCDKNSDCCDGATCKGKKCKCKSGYDDCDGNGKCERVTNDDANCGACENICPDGENCRDGTCERCVPLTPLFEQPPQTCSSDAECCGDGLCCTFDDESGGFITGCYDLLTHATACGLSCDAVVNCHNTGQICVDGECVVDPQK
jgi:hypothetical protein